MKGWRLIAGRFDDGGLSGASLERPALQALLDQVRAQKIDVIIVYKVDRLTRSLGSILKTLRSRSQCVATPTRYDAVQRIVTIIC